MSKTGAAFSVRFLRNGDNVIIVRNIVNRKESGLALFQVVDPNTGVVTPTWDATGKDGAEKEAVLDAQPIIRLGVRSAYQYPAEITGVTWLYNGADLKFTLDGANWVNTGNATYAGKFQARINGANYELKIVGDLASKEEVANRQITYDVAYACNGMTDKVRGSVDVLIQAAGSNSHMLQISTDRVELDAKNESAELTAVGMYGAEYVTIGANGYTIKWYKDGDEISNATAAKLKVTRKDVTGGSIFVAKLFLNGSAVAQDSQRINDTADKYPLVWNATNAGANWLGIGHNATYNLSLTCNKKLYAGQVTYEWSIINAIGDETGKGTGSLVTVEPHHAIVRTEDTSYYYDCDVLVTADF